MSTEATVARLMAMIAAYASYASRNATQQQAVMLHADIEAALRAALDLGEPVAWDVYIASQQHGYLVDSLNDPQLIDDLTNTDAVVSPLYAPKDRP